MARRCRKLLPAREWALRKRVAHEGAAVCSLSPADTTPAGVPYEASGPTCFRIAPSEAVPALRLLGGQPWPPHFQGGSCTGDRPVTSPYGLPVLRLWAGQAWPSHQEGGSCREGTPVTPLQAYGVPAWKPRWPPWYPMPGLGGCPWMESTASDAKDSNDRLRCTASEAAAEPQRMPGTAPHRHLHLSSASDHSTASAAQSTAAPGEPSDKPKAGAIEGAGGPHPAPPSPGADSECAKATPGAHFGHFRGMSSCGASAGEAGSQGIEGPNSMGTSNGSTASLDPSQGHGTPGKMVLYRGKWMRLFRILVRFKVAQLVAVGATAAPIAMWTQGGQLSALDLGVLGAVVAGAGAASGALWYYSSRYIGELALIPPSTVVISTLDFWGNRENALYHISEVVPPLQDLSHSEIVASAKLVFTPLDVASGRQYVLSLRHGRLLDKKILLALLTGMLHEESPPHS